VKCQYCQEETFLPFKCPFCSGYYCVQHRLPENHECPEYWKAKIPRREPAPIVLESPTERILEEYVRPIETKPKNTVFWFSLTELKHLAIAALLVMGVGMSLFWSIRRASPLILVSLAVIFTLSFFIHEMAHKMTAQHFGLWAEFRLTTIGALLTLISVISPFFKIVSPGAVMIAGSGSRESFGKISLAGPLINLMLSIIFLVVASLTLGYISLIAFLGSFINAFIAFFNLIPFGIFDGLKVFNWNKSVWAAAFLLALTLFTWAFIHIY
jgi:Zn-dependent protease